MDIAFQPIGVIRTPYTEPKGMPIQPAGAAGVRGTVEVFEAYREGLADLDGFSHIVLLYHLHRSEGYRPRVVPFLDTAERGLFATRAPKRPNPIGHFEFGGSTHMMIFQKGKADLEDWAREAERHRLDEKPTPMGTIIARAKGIAT